MAWYPDGCLIELADAAVGARGLQPPFRSMRVRYGSSACVCSIETIAGIRNCKGFRVNSISARVESIDVGRCWSCVRWWGVERVTTWLATG